MTAAEVYPDFRPEDAVRAWLEEQVNLQQAEIRYRIALTEHIRTVGMPAMPESDK